MPRIKQLHLVYFWLALFLFSMVYSKFLLSVSMFGLGFSAVFIISEATGKLQFRSGFFKNFRTFLDHPTFWSLGLLVMVYLLSGFYSDDLSEWWWRVRTKSPFLLIPLTFFIYEKWPKALYERVMMFFVIVMSLSALWVSGYYLSHQEEVVELLRVGKTMPTPCHHIRFSIMLSIAAIIAVYHLLFDPGQRPRWLYPICVVLLVIGLHVLSVRSGLITLYLGLFSLAMIKLFQNGRSIISILILLMILAVPFIAYRMLPSFKQKIDYVRWDLQQFQKTEGDNYSDSERILSLRAGWEIWRSNPLFGVGIGDLRSSMKTYYLENYEKEEAKFPHNQFLFVLAGCGLIGAILFFGGFFWPLIAVRTRYKALLFAIYVILTASFMVENTIETAVGTATTLFWIVFFIKEGHDHPMVRRARSHEDDKSVG